MRAGRAPLLLAGGGVLLLLLLAVLGAVGVPVMPSYLAAWLFVLAVPVGALLLVTGIEMLEPDPSQERLMAPLRSLLPVLPLAAACGLPVLLLSPGLFDTAAWPASGIGRGWSARGLFSVRMIVILLVWSGLAVLFTVPARSDGRRGVAGLAFALTLVSGTVAAFDWVMAVEPGLASSSFGLLVLAGFVVSALAAAVLLMGPDAVPRAAATAMLALLAVWVFLHFSQFLVVWSANKPDEARWYLHRIGGLGAAALWLAAAVALAGVVLLAAKGASRWTVPVAAMLLLVRLLESFWLVTPSYRGGFVLLPADLLAAAGLVGLVGGAWLGGWIRMPGRLRHVGT